MADMTYGWIPQLTDIRDYLFDLVESATVPERVDLRDKLPPVGDQGAIGSCTSWASTGAYRYELNRQGLPDFESSELASYFWTREIEGTTKSDAGATIRDAVKTLAKVGTVHQELWPYDTSKVFKAPPAKVKKQARQHLAVSYHSVLNAPPTIKQALSAGYPIVFGVSVYASFESVEAARTGVIPLPQTGESLLGGHAIVLVGYDSPKQQYTFRNSWGTDWGDGGYGYLSEEYVRRLGSDLWVIQTVS